MDISLVEVNNALRVYKECFIKILKVNLTNGNFEIIRLESTEFDTTLTNIYKWFEGFSKSNLIHPSDVLRFKLETEMDKFKRNLTKKRFHKIRYRRKFGNTYHWVMLEASPTPNYTDDNMEVYVFIRDVDEDFNKITEAIIESQQYESIKNKDDNGLCNRKAFDTLLQDISLTYYMYSLGMIYFKLLDARQVDKCVDFLQDNFRADECFSLGNGTFVVVMKGISQNYFKHTLETVRKTLITNEIPLSIGFHWSECNNSPKAILKQAIYMVNKQV